MEYFREIGWDMETVREWERYRDGQWVRGWERHILVLRLVLRKGYKHISWTNLAYYVSYFYFVDFCIMKKNSTDDISEEIPEKKTFSNMTATFKYETIFMKT